MLFSTLIVRSYVDITVIKPSVIVTKITNDFSAKNYQRQQYLNEVVELLRGDCKIADKLIEKYGSE